MANKKISELNSATTAKDSDLLMVVQDGANKKMEINVLKESLKEALKDQNTGSSNTGEGLDWNEMDLVENPGDNDLVAIRQGSTTKKTKVSAIRGKGSGSGEGLDWNAMSETANPANDDYLVIRQGSVNKKVKISAIKGAENLTESYVELKGDDGALYRLEVINGKPVLTPSAAYTAADPSEGDQALYYGLLINSMYGGGTQTSTAVSHSFVELYNANRNPINLKGLYLWYKAGNGTWEPFPLKGMVPPQSSFLIRGGEHSTTARLKIKEYDMSIDKKFTNNGFTLHITIGNVTPDTQPVRQIVDGSSGAVTYTNGRYIDMLGAGGVDVDTGGIQSYEGGYLNALDANTGVRRIDFMNSLMKHLSSADALAKFPMLGSNQPTKGNNIVDIMPINYKTCDLSIYRPRCTNDGEWSSFIDKPKLKTTCPNLMNICYGEDGNTSRTFTWQTGGVTKNGSLKIRPVDEDGSPKGKWIEYDSEKEIVSLTDGDITIHRVIVHDLTYGFYEYIAGEEGAWSDAVTFEVVNYGPERPLRVIQTSDEQGWSESEYKACQVSSRFIQDNEEFDFHINTGDISQNGDRSFEWRYYFENYHETLKCKPHMNVCGNNDLMDNKKFSTAFRWYSTHENQRFNSCYAYDVGFVHFVALQAWSDSTYIDATKAAKEVEAGVPDEKRMYFNNTDEFFNAITKWFDDHLGEVMQRETKPRWLVVQAHLSPFTVQRLDRLQRWVAVCEKYKVDVFMCGHNHAYSRSIPIYCGYDAKFHYDEVSKKWTPEPYNEYLIVNNAVTVIDEKQADGETPINKAPDKANGTYYMMSNATSYKLSGKVKNQKLGGNITFRNKDGEALTPEQKAEHLSKETGALAAGTAWWSAAQSLSNSCPNYIMYEFAYDSITITSYIIRNVLNKDGDGNLIVKDYNPVKEGEELDTTVHTYKEIHDKPVAENEYTIKILYSDRNKA